MPYRSLEEPGEGDLPVITPPIINYHPVLKSRVDLGLGTIQPQWRFSRLERGGSLITGDRLQVVFDPGFRLYVVLLLR